jgi:phosphatidylglycerophosphate synthase
MIPGTLGSPGRPDVSDTLPVVPSVTRAIVVALSAASDRAVAGLPLGARAALALRLAGVPDVMVYATPERAVVREVLARRGMAVYEPGDPGAAEDAAGTPPVLLLAGNLLVDGLPVAPARVPPAPGVVCVLVIPGLPPDEVGAAVVPADAVRPILRKVAGGARSLGAALAAIGARLEPAVPAPGALVLPAAADRPIAALERALLDHQRRRTVRADGYLAIWIDRRLARPLTRLLLRSPATPAQITLAGVAAGLLGAAGLGMVSEPGRLLGILSLVLSGVLDCVDGEVARARLEESAAGARLDLAADYLVHLATFVGLGVGLVRQGLPPAGRWAVLALVIGVGAAMALMHAAFVGPLLARSGRSLHPAAPAPGRRGPVETVVEKMASRDYVYVLLLCALVGHLEWFLYAAAVGAWAFVAGLLGYRPPWVVSSSKRA